MQLLGFFKLTNLIDVPYADDGELQALIDGEWWPRAVKELDHAVRNDPSPAKALWRRYRCQKHLKKWAEAEAALEALQAPQLQAAAGPLLASAGLGPEELARTRAELTHLEDFFPAVGAVVVAVVVVVVPVRHGDAGQSPHRAVSYTHLTLRRRLRCRSRWSPYH